MVILSAKVPEEAADTSEFCSERRHFSPASENVLTYFTLILFDRVSRTGGGLSGVAGHAAQPSND